MRRLITRALSALALLCALSSSALAVDVTIAGASFPAYNYSGATARLRIYPSQTFTASDSVTVPGGTAPGSKTGFFYTVNCTVASNTLTCPSVTLKSTTDALDLRDTTYTVKLFDASDTPRDFFPLSDFALPHTFGATTTWAAVRDYNLATARPPGPNYYDADQTNAAINANNAVGNPAKPYASPTPLGRVALSVAAADPTLPIAVGTNDPRVNAESNAASYASLSEAVASIGSSAQTLVVSDTQTVSSSMSVPANVVLRFTGGGTVSVASGQTLTINGPVESAPRPRFAGSGTVNYAGPTETLLAWFATSGSGSQSAPFAGWSTKVSWADDRAFHATKGWYDFSAPLNLPYDRINVYGDGTEASVLHFTGAGIALSFNSPSAKKFGQQLRDLTVKGNPNCTDGVYLDGNQAFTMRNVSAVEGTRYAFHFRWVIASVFDNLRGLNSIASNTTRWTCVLFTEQGAGGGGATFQANTFHNLRLEEATGSGGYLSYAVQNVFDAGTSEYNDGRGVYVTSTSHGNTFVGMDNEANLLDDWTIEGNDNILVGVLSAPGRVGASGMTRITGNTNHVIGGRLESLRIEAGATFNDLHAPGYKVSGVGSFTDLGTDTQGAASPHEISTGAYNPLHIAAFLRISGNSSVNQQGGTTDINTGLAPLQFGAAGLLAADKASTDPASYFGSNAVINNTGSWRYIVSKPAGLLTLNGGEAYFRLTTSGTSGAAITWVIPMKQLSDGSVQINDGGTLKTISFGAADSCGTGFKCLRIAN